MSVQGGNREFRRLLETVQRLVGVETAEILEPRGHLVAHADIRAGREELVAVAGQQHDVDVVVETGAQDGLADLAHHVVGVRVRGGSSSSMIARLSSVRYCTSVLTC